jgi:hypothetical protein
MLKYQLKKGVLIEPNMAFKYMSMEELKALLYALGESDHLARQTEMSGTSLKESGFLLLSWVQPTYSNVINDNFERKYIVRKYLIGSHEYVVKKKDFFYKTEYNDASAGENKKVYSHHDVINSTVVAKGIVTGSFEGKGYRMGMGATSTEFKKQNDVNTDTLLQEKKLIENKRQKCFISEPNLLIREIDLGDELGKCLVINKKFLEALKGPNSFFDLLYNLKTVIDKM